MALPLYILLCSGEHEKVQMAAMIASVGAVSERPVEVFVSINAIMAFARDTPAETRYRGSAFCPGPLMELIAGPKLIEVGAEIEVLSSDKGSAADIPEWVKRVKPTRWSSGWPSPAPAPSS